MFSSSMIIIFEIWGQNMVSRVIESVGDAHHL